MLQMGMFWGVLIVWDDICSVEFLVLLFMVYKEKIGIMGFFMGVYCVWMVSVVIDVVKVGVVVCWMNIIDSLMIFINNQNKGGFVYFMIIFGIWNWMDYFYVVFIVCFKLMLFINGLWDKFFFVKGVESVFFIMQDVWKS